VTVCQRRASLRRRSGPGRSSATS